MRSMFLNACCCLVILICGCGKGEKSKGGWDLLATVEAAKRLPKATVLDPVSITIVDHGATTDGIKTVNVKGRFKLPPGTARPDTVYAYFVKVNQSESTQSGDISTNKNVGVSSNKCVRNHKEDSYSYEISVMVPSPEGPYDVTIFVPQSVLVQISSYTF